MSGQPAARLHDPIAHNNAHARFWAKFAGGLIGGIAVGFAAGVAVAAVVGTGGLAGPLVAGAVVVGARVAGGYVGASLGESIADALVPETLTVTGAITSASSDVFVNDRATGAARASPDLPMDTVSCSRDSPQILLAEGAETVFINRGVAARKGDHTECGAQVGEGSPNVFIGGPTARVRDVADEVPLISRIAVTVLNLAMIYRGLRCLPQLARGGRKALPCLVEGSIGVGMGVHGMVSSFGHPVHAATGGKFLGGEAELDFRLPGPLPIEWQRFYSSHDLRRDGALGQGWNLPYASQLRLDADAAGEAVVVLVDTQGREVELPDLAPGTRQRSLREGLDLCRSEGGDYFIHVPGGLFYLFEAPAGGPRRAQSLKLVRVEDRNGNFIDLRHDPLGRLAAIADGTGRLLALDYVGQGPRLEAVRIAVGAPGESPGLLVRYRHDAEGRLAEVTDRNGVVARRFAYDAQGLMCLHADAAGLACRYEWTGIAGEARVARHWTSDGEHHEVRWERLRPADASPPDDPNVAVGETRVLDQLGRTFAWQWNDEHQILGYTNAEGQCWGARYNALGQLVAITEPDGATTRCDYDAQGFPSRRTDALGRTRSTGWTDFGLPWRETEADGSANTYAYSDEGNLVRETDPLGQATEYAYDRRGLPILVTDARGGRNRLRWDERALLVAFTDCSGKTTRYEHDGCGHPKAVIDAAGHRTSLTHDAMGRLLSVSLPDGSHQSFERDAAGRLVGATDALSRATRFALDVRGEPLWRQDAEGRRFGWQRDSAQRLLSMVNENGLRFEFVRDRADRIVEERRVGGTCVRIAYDANGRPVTITQLPGIGDDDLDLAEAGRASAPGARALRTELVRDVAGRLIEKRTATHHYRYRYDLRDRLTEALKLEAKRVDDAIELRPLHRTCFAYDSLGRLTNEIAIDERTGERHDLQHEHDVLGHRTRTVLPALAGDPGTVRALNYLHYGSGHLHQVNVSHQRDGAAAVHRIVSDIERDDLHREIVRSQGALTTRFALDPLGRRTAAWCRPSSLAAPFTPGDEAWNRAIGRTSEAGALDGLVKAYGYDPVGELRHGRHSLQGAFAHRYDATGRVEESVRMPFGPAGQATRSAAHHERFAYDPAGNLLDASLASEAARGGTGGRVHDNLVRVFEDKRYSYDGHGRLVRKRAGRHTEQHFEWDDESRLVAVHTTRRPGTEEATTQTTRFDYDALGRRVARHDAFGCTRFIWEGMRLIEERRGAQVLSYVYEPASHAPMARLEAQAPSSGGEAGGGDLEICHFHTNQAGMAEELSSADGTLRWRASYRTWGATVSEHWQACSLDGRPVPSAAQGGGGSVPPIEQNLRFQGQYLDRDTGLHYNTFRFYDPDIGRFISPDPIGLAGGTNLHLYAPNPVSWIDPWGWSFIDAVGGASERTGKKFQGAEIYRFIEKVKVDGTTFKRGDYYYLDNLHKDHYETFSKNDTSKGVFNLDGTKNESKSKKAAKRIGPGC